MKEEIKYCTCESPTHTAGTLFRNGKLGKDLIICTKCKKEMQISLKSVDDYIKEKCKDPKFKKLYDEHQFNFKRMMDDMFLQNEIESLLDDFKYRIKTQYAIDYLDIRREVARLILAKIGGHYETKKRKKK